MIKIKTLSHLLWGAVLGTGVTLGMFIGSSFIKKQMTDVQTDRFYRVQMGIMADKNYNKTLDYKEMYNLALKLDVIKSGEDIGTKELAERIKKAPLERVKSYLNIKDKEYDWIIPF